MKQANLALIVLGLAFAGAAPSQARPLAKDMAGEACETAGPAALSKPAIITCAGARAGTLYLTSLGPARAGALADAIRVAEGSDTACDKGQAIDADTALYFCTVTNSAWPRLALVRSSARGVFVADGLPGMAPVLADAIAGDSGTASPVDAVAKLVQAKFAMRILEAGGGDYARYQSQIALARQRSALGNYAGAENAYREALDVESRLFGDDSAVAAQTMLELALEVSNQQRFDEAQALLRRVTPIIDAMASNPARARLSSYLALDAANRRDYANALKFAREATAARRADIESGRAAPTGFGGGAAASPAQEAELAHALRIDAEMAMRLGDYPGAEAAAQEALYIMTEQAGMPLAWRADMVSLMGEISERAAKVVVAERDFVQAAEMNRRLFGNGGPTATAEIRLGRFYADQQLYMAALDSYRKGLAGLNDDPAARRRLVSDQIVPFLTAASAAELAGKDREQADADMYRASQLIESGVEGQTIARVAARQAVADPALRKELQDSEDAARKLASLRMTLAVERAIPAEQRDPVREKALVAGLDSARSASEALQAKVQKDFPQYARLASPGPVSLDDMRKRLRPHEGFVSFVIGVRASFVLLVTRDGLTAKPIAVTHDSLAEDIADLRTAFSSKLGVEQPFSLKNAYALYGQLLRPLEKQLSELDRLAVSASGDLSSLPFSMLITADPGESRSYQNAGWLVRRVAIVQVPSASAFLALRDAPHPQAARPLLGLGNPVFTGARQGDGLAALSGTCQQGGPANAALLRALPPLPDTASELSQVAADLKSPPGDLLLGTNATEAALRQKPLDQYGVLYFATHGLLPGELHCQQEPALVLSPPDATAAATDVDGLLTASEIASLKLNADLVVLSACNTAAGGGTAFGGGALDGLADAFFEAGARAVLASHWKVSSAATTQLMAALFANLAVDPSQDAAQALRKAQLAMIASGATAHPFNWAAFTLIGAGVSGAGT